MPGKKAKKTVKSKLTLSSEGVVESDTPKGMESVGSAPVSHVVEVVEESLPPGAAEPLREIKEEAKDIEHNVEILEKVIVPPEPSEDRDNASEQEAQLEEVSSGQEEDKDARALSDMFNTRSPIGLTEISEHKAGNPRAVVVWSVIMVVLTLLCGFVLLRMKRISFSLPVFFSKPTPSPAPQATPTPTPVPPNKEEITIEVINGGGLAGAGSRMKAFLEEKGYTVSRVGNADEYTYEETEIHIKPSKGMYLSILEEDIKQTYSIGSASSDLTDDASYAAQVIVGKE